MNEINDMLDLEMGDVTDPVGDMRFVPSNLIPTTDLLFEPITPDKSKNTGKTIGKIQEFLEKGEKETEIKSSRASYVRYWSRLQRNSNRKIKSKVGRYFSDQLGKILNIINNNKSVNKDINGIEISMLVKNLLEEEKGVLVKMITPVYEGITKDASDLAIRTMGIDIQPRVWDDIAKGMANKVTTINDSVYKLFKAQLKESINAGESLAQLEKRMVLMGKFNSGYASTRIARTESCKLVNASTHAEYIDNGVELKSVITAGDTEVRDTHIQNANDGEIPINRAFSGTGEQYPGESEINCRCCLIPVIK